MASTLLTWKTAIKMLEVLVVKLTSSSATAEGPHDALS